MPHRSRHFPYRLISLLLAALWAGLALLGAAEMARCQAAATPTAQATARAACRCCHGLMRGGHRRCCCHLASSPSQQACIQERCVGGTPKSAILLVWSPYFHLPDGSVLSLPHSQRHSLRPARFHVTSLPATPPTRPPALL